MKKIVTACVCALSLFACGTSEKQEEPRNENPGAQAVQAPAKATMTESALMKSFLVKDSGLELEPEGSPELEESVWLGLLVESSVPVLLSSLQAVHMTATMPSKILPRWFRNKAIFSPLIKRMLLSLNICARYSVRK